ncbi:MAG: CBS domain-containing protein [Desulfobacterales bacterium]|nr:CBS domain-containing protein [Desulfobacterales bacterium]
MGDKRKTVREIMCPIEEYERIDAEAPLCEALHHLKRYQRKLRADENSRFHKTTFVTGAAGGIIGKLSLYDFIRGLVPEPARDEDYSRKFSALVSSRALEVAAEIGETRKRFKWLHTSFPALVKQETRKRVKDVMSPVAPLLVEGDTINKAVYIMFRENIRQAVVTRAGEFVGVINLQTIFSELLQIADDQCLTG